MKKTVRSVSISFVAVLFIESIARLVVSVYHRVDFSGLSYVQFPDLWPYGIMAISIFAAFFGGMLVNTLSSARKVPFFSFLGVIVLWRLSPLLLLPTEPLFFVILSAVLSILAVLGSYRLYKTNMEKSAKKNEN